MRKFSPRVTEAVGRLKGILKKSKQVGLTADDLFDFPITLRLLDRCSKSPEKTVRRKQTFLVGVAVLAALAFFLDLHTHKGFSSFWLKWTQNEKKDPFCTIPMPNDLSSVFRPPAPCSICEGVTSVDKVSGLTPELFEARYAYSGVPVVVTDAMTNWTAQHVFSFDFFRKIYSRRMDEWRLFRCQFLPYSTGFGTLEDVFEMDEERARGSTQWYVGWSNCDDEINQILRRHYQKPYFLPATAESKRLDWIFMGTPGHGAPMHVDNVEHPSWQAQLKGKKRWTLRPPPECFYKCNTVEVLVEPGQIIVLDTNQWYHSTEIVSEDLSITIGAEYD